MKKSIPASVVASFLTLFGPWTLLLLCIPYSPSLGLLLKIVVWGLPALLLPELMEGARPYDHLLLNRAPKFRWILPSAVFLILYPVLLNGGRVQVNSVSVFYVASAVVVSPLVEEMAFRGVVLQKLDQFMSLKLSNSVTTILFILYHCPLWVARGQAVSLPGCAWVAFFSLWMGFFLRRSKSLWTCIIIHALQNLVFGLLQPG